MAEALRDANHKKTMTAVQADGTITLGKIDGVTGRLLVSIQHVASIAAPLTQTLVRDDNRVVVAGGATSAGAAKAMLIDDANDYLIVDLTIE